MCWRVFIKFIPFWILFWIVSVGIFAQNFEQEYKKLKAKPREPGYVELLSRVPITTELWSMMVLNYWDLTGSSPEKLWPCDVIKQNQLLEDDPYDVLRLPIFHALKYEPKWEVFPRPRSEYARKYFLVGNYQKSAEQLEIMEKSEPFNLHLLFSLALLYEHLGDFQAAAQRLRLVRERAADSQTRLLALRWSARLQVRLGNLSMAENLLLKLVSALKRLVGQSLSKKADRSKLFPLEKRLSEVENLLGIVRFQEGKKVLAFNGFLELEKRFPGNFAFVFNKNKIFLETRKYESTLKSTNKALNTLRVLISGFQARMVQEVKSGILVKAGKLADTRSAFERLHSLLLRRKGEILFREKLYPRALKLFEESVRKNPRDDVSYFRMGEIHVELKNLDRALARFRRAAEHAVEGSKIQKEALGWIDKIFAQQAVDAIAEEDPVRKKRDEFFQTLDVDERDEILELGEIISIGQKWLATGEHKKLIRYFRGLLSEHSNVLEVWYLLARAYREMGLSILARFYYGRALEIDPRHIPSLAAKTYYLSIAHRFEETLSVLEFMESFASGNHQLLGAWGWYHYQKSEYQKAVTFYQEAIEKEPQYSEHHYRLGMVYFQTRLYRFALHKFQDAQTAGYPWSRASLFRGVSHLYLGEVVKGEEALRKAVQYGKDNPDIQNFARDILKGLRESQRFEIGMMPDLGKYLERSFPRFKTRSVTQSSLRNSLDEIRSGRTFQVAERLRNRLQQDPENLELMHVLGYLHLLLDREDLAAEYFSSALDRNPLDYRAMNSLSEIEFRRGRIDECVLYWEKMKKVSALIDYSTLLKEFSEDFLKRFEFNPADEWAIYQYALLKLHTHKEEDALDILEQITPTFQDRKSPFSDRLLVLHGQVLFKLGILQEKEEWINMGRGLLSRAGYRYLDLIDRYKRGAVVLEPPRKIPYKVRPAPKAQLDFLKLQRTLEVARTEPLQSIPLRRKADYLRSWKLVDRALALKDPKKVKSSYDLYLQRRESPAQKYLESRDQFARRQLLESTEEKQQREALASDMFSQALGFLESADLGKAKKSLISTLSERIDLFEAFYALTLINFVQGEYVDLVALMRALPERSEYAPTWKLMKAHIHFHQGDFEAAQELVSGLTIPLILPNSKAFEILERIYREVNDRAPGDLESSLKLALLYQSVGRFVEAERVLRQAGTRPGLIPYLCEVLMLRGIVERRMDPVREAVKKMAELSSSQEKQVYQDLATQLDRFLLTYRFLAK